MVGWLARQREIVDRCLGWQPLEAAPTSDRGGEMSPYGVTRGRPPLPPT